MGMFELYHPKKFAAQTCLCFRFS